MALSRARVELGIALEVIAQRRDEALEQYKKAHAAAPDAEAPLLAARWLTPVRPIAPALELATAHARIAGDDEVRAERYVQVACLHRSGGMLDQGAQRVPPGPFLPGDPSSGSTWTRRRVAGDAPRQHDGCSQGARCPPRGHGLRRRERASLLSLASCRTRQAPGCGASTRRSPQRSRAGDETRRRFAQRARCVHATLACAPSERSAGPSVVVLRPTGFERGTRCAL